MFFLTKQERIVLLLFLLVAVTGSVLSFAFKKYPHLSDLVNFIDSDDVYPKVDINTASKEELLAVPYIGEFTARLIIEYRQKHGPFQTVHQLQTVSGIRKKNFEIFSKYLKI